MIPCIFKNTYYLCVLKNVPKTLVIIFIFKEITQPHVCQAKAKPNLTRQPIHLYDQCETVLKDDETHLDSIAKLNIE